MAAEGRERTTGPKTQELQLGNLISFDLQIGTSREGKPRGEGPQNGAPDVMHSKTIGATKKRG